MVGLDERALADIQSTFDLPRLRFADAVTVGQHLRKCGDDLDREDAAAQRVVEYLYEVLRDIDTATPSCALIRCFQTHPYADLPEAYQAAARRGMDGDEPASDLRCLALLATRGLEAAWNQPETSVGHLAIPLTDVASIEQRPMVARLVAQMGLEPRHLVEPRTALLMNASEYRNFGVFHVETAGGSVYLPAQQTFVEQYGIRSVVGMGGLLPSGEFFAVILFAQVTISREIAELFRTLALSVKLTFLPFAPDAVFTVSPECVV